MPDRILDITNTLSLQLQKKSELITFVSPIAMATSEQLEDLLETNIITMVHFHFWLIILKTTTSLSKERKAPVEVISPLEGVLQNIYGNFG